MKDFRLSPHPLGLIASNTSPLTAFTPALSATSGETSGGATYTGYYAEVGEGLLYVEMIVAITAAATHSWGTAPRLSLPDGYTCAALFSPIFGVAYDAGGTAYLAMGMGSSASNSGDLSLYDFSTESAISDSSPFTWADSDYLTLSGVLHVAPE